MLHSMQNRGCAHSSRRCQLCIDDQLAPRTPGRDLLPCNSDRLDFEPMAAFEAPMRELGSWQPEDCPLPADRQRKLGHSAAEECVGRVFL